MTKAVSLADAIAIAIAMMPEGAVEMLGGVMGVGSPHRLIDELVRPRRGGRTLIFNDTEGSAAQCPIFPGLDRRSWSVAAGQSRRYAVSTWWSPNWSSSIPLRPVSCSRKPRTGVSVREVLDATDATLILSPGLAE